MGWQENHKRRVSAFPELIRSAHAHASAHRVEIERSESCGCFFCLSIFTPSAIAEWTDENEEGIGQTAICPHCGVDSVIGTASGISVTAGFLTEMYSLWFGDG